MNRCAALTIGLVCATGLPGRAAGEVTDKIHPSLEWLTVDVGRPVKAWVYFTDKGHADAGAEAAALEAAATSLNPRTLQRRLHRRTAPGLMDARDLPVAERYVEAVEALGVDVHVRSRWLNAVSVTADADKLEAIAGLPFVDRLEPVRRSAGVQPLDPNLLDVSLLAPAGGYGFSHDQMAFINLIPLHDHGFTGEGIVIGVLDTGFVTIHRAFNHPDKPLDVIAQYDFINDDANVGYEPGDDRSQHEHGTIILGILAGYDPGAFIGAAPDASYILCKTEDVTDEYRGEEDFYVAGLEFIEANGGDVATSSLSYLDWYTQDDLDGQTAVTTIAVNAATENGVVCCTAAGNNGHDRNPSTSHLGAPADAFDVITVGAAATTGETSGFSSDGPTADGRVKPEVIAVGENAASVHPSHADAYGDYDGTSMSTPHIAGAVACLLQARPSWTVDALRARLFESARNIDGQTIDPYFITGYGIPDVFASFDTLYFEGVEPGIAGQVNELSASNATPGARVAFVWGLREGRTAMPGCPGWRLRIGDPRLAAMTRADAKGRATATVAVPATARGRAVVLQAAEPDACRPGNWLTTVFE